MQHVSQNELIHTLTTENDILKKARIIDVLRNEYEIRLPEIAAHLSKHPSYISHIHRLLRVPQLVIDGYYSQQISATHLMILSRLQTPAEIEEAYEEVLTNNLTSTQTELVVRRMKYDVVSDNQSIPPNELKKIEVLLQDTLQGKVRILQSQVRSKIVIEQRGPASQTSAFIRKIVSKLKSEPKEEPEQEDLPVLE
ncbi:MAG: hypothetical protein O3B87_02200 [bacterium]|nr:hypothetical protein [bacterium]